MIDFRLDFIIINVVNAIGIITKCVFTKSMLVVVAVVKAFTSQILHFFVDDYDCFITISYKLCYLTFIIIIIIIVPDNWFYSSGFG